MPARQLAVDGVPSAELSDGTVLAADLIICATGFTQGVPFLDREVKARLFDERANFMLYRQLLPADVDDLYFAGYNSSFFSPLNAEIGDIWITAHLAGQVKVPDRAALRTEIEDRLAFLDVATNGHHCRGTKIIPFSMHNVDELLADLGLNISRATRALHWLAPINPSAHRAITPKVLRTASVAGPRPVHSSSYSS